MVNVCTDLNSGWRLSAGESLFSALGGFRLTMQDDGNLVLYAIDDMKLPGDILHVFACTPDVMKLYAKPIWSTGTHVPKEGTKRGSFCVMREDGNFLVCDEDGRSCFETGTLGHPGSFMRLQTDGNVVIYTRGLKVVWRSNTAARTSGPAKHPARPVQPRPAAVPSDNMRACALSKDLRAGMRLRAGDSLFSPLAGFRLILQDDGNLVLYVIDDRRIPLDAACAVFHSPEVWGIYETAIWSTATDAFSDSGRAGAYCIMKDDGNFVVSDEDGNACFQTGTKGNPGAFLRCQDDGNLVIYTRENKAIWQSKTYARIDDVPSPK